MKLRIAKIKDAGAISRLEKLTVVRLNSPFYAKKQILAWKNVTSAAGFRKGISNRRRYIVLAEEGKLIAGFGVLNLEKKKISGMYVSCGKISRGIGRKIIAALEKQAKKTGIKKLVLNSSLSAVGFYQKMGYRPIKKTTTLVGKVKIPCVYMVKKIIKNLI